MKHVNATVAASLASLLLVTGCVQAPIGPTVAVMPGPNKPFDAFQADQGLCRQFADQEIGGGAQAAQTETNQALIGTGVGALLGAGAEIAAVDAVRPSIGVLSDCFTHKYSFKI